MRQTWRDLLFAHWPVPYEQLRALVPSQLALDTYDGKCWAAVAPFHMSGIRGRFMPPVPAASALAELNVRTYVTYGGKPGVYFFSLDAASRIAVRAARTFYKLPYFFLESAWKSATAGFTISPGEPNLLLNFEHVIDPRSRLNCGLLVR